MNYREGNRSPYRWRERFFYYSVSRMPLPSASLDVGDFTMAMDQPSTSKPMENTETARYTADSHAVSSPEYDDAASAPQVRYYSFVEMIY